MQEEHPREPEHHHHSTPKIPVDPMRKKRAVSEEISHHRMRYAKKIREINDIFRDFTIFSLNFSNHHPNHEDEVILRRKLKEEKEQIDEAPIVPVLRPQKIEESPGKDSKLKLEYLSPI